MVTETHFTSFQDLKDLIDRLYDNLRIHKLDVKLFFIDLSLNGESKFLKTPGPCLIVLSQFSGVTNFETSQATRRISWRCIDDQRPDGSVSAHSGEMITSATCASAPAESGASLAAGGI